MRFHNCKHKCSAFVKQTKQKLQALLSLSLLIRSGSGGAWWTSEPVTSLPGQHFCPLPTSQIPRGSWKRNKIELSHVRTMEISLFMNSSLPFLSPDIPANSSILLILNLEQSNQKKFFERGCHFSLCPLDGSIVPVSQILFIPATFKMLII